MLTTVPFSGFYYSQHDEALDYALEQLFWDEDGETNDGLVAHAHFECDWVKVQVEYARHYVDAFGEGFGVKLKFDEMKSPREYNFTTDRLFATISRADVRRLFREADKACLTKVCEDNLKSRSGFISFYDHVWRNWGSVDTWDHNQVGMLLEALVEPERGCWNEYGEFYLMTSYRDNGYFDKWICDAIPKDKLDRYFRIHQYLRQRQDRQPMRYYKELA